MQHVSSLGGPRVLLPTSEIGRWIDELGATLSPDSGLYGHACSVDRYCGVIAPWNTPLLIFGDYPADIFYLPEQYDGLFFRWIGADSMDQLVSFAIAEADVDSWDETTIFDVVDQDMTVMDTCSFNGDTAPRIQLKMPTGSYAIRSRYAASDSVMTVVHRFERSG